MRKKKDHVDISVDNMFTVVLRLDTDESQFDTLMKLMHMVNQAANKIAVIAKNNNISNLVKLHHAVYYDIRGQYPELNSQHVCSVIKRVSLHMGYLKEKIKYMQQVANRYKNKYKYKHKYEKQCKGLDYFKNKTLFYRYTTPLFLYYKLGYKLNKNNRTVNIRTTKTSGVQEIKYTVCKYYKKLLEAMTKYHVAKLFYNKKKKKFYLHVTGIVPVNFRIKKHPNPIGVDLGYHNLYCTSTGFYYKGNEIWPKVLHQLNHYSILKIADNGSEKAKSYFNKSSGRLRRYLRNMCHIVSKNLIEYAKNREVTDIVLEYLNGLQHSYVSGSYSQYVYNKWPIFKFSQFIQYKALNASILVTFVNPKDTSITCSKCGYKNKRARIYRDIFECPICGVMNADINAAKNILTRGLLKIFSMRNQIFGNAAQSTS